jgi:hypothetical protein
MTSNFILQLNTCGYSCYVILSLTKGQVCRLQLLLVLARAVILRSESHGTHDHILLSQIRDSPNLEGQVPPYLYPPSTRWPSYTSRHWVPFSSPPTTRRATVEVFEPASTRGPNNSPLKSFLSQPCTTEQKTPFPTIRVLLFTDPLLRNWFFYWRVRIRCRMNALPSRCLAMNYFGGIS